MELLSIFHTGGLTLILTILFLVGEVAFFNQGLEHSKAEGYKWYKSPFIKYYAAGVLVLYVVALLIIASDYKGV